MYICKYTTFIYIYVNIPNLYIKISCLTHILISSKYIPDNVYIHPSLQNSCSKNVHLSKVTKFSVGRDSCTNWEITDILSK